MKLQFGDIVRYKPIPELCGPIVSIDVNGNILMGCFDYVVAATGTYDVMGIPEHFEPWKPSPKDVGSNLPVYQGSLSQYDSPYIKSLLKFS